MLNIVIVFKPTEDCAKDSVHELKYSMMEDIPQILAKTAWEYIYPAIITKSFKKCSISNDLDGAEDEVLWAEQYNKSDTDSDEEGDDT